jgi:hypothetical protein
MKKWMGFAATVLLVIVVACALACGMPPVVQEKPAETPPSDHDLQKRTVADMRNTGTAMFSWLTDQVGAAAAGQSQVPEPIDLAEYARIAHADLTTLLVPTYMQEVPELDGWESPYEFYVNVDNPLAKKVLGIRSAGRDKAFSGNVYTVTSFEPTSFDEDLVWADGYFVRWPQRR